MIIDRSFFSKAFSDVVFAGCEDATFEKFVIDSRKATVGSTFIALKGEHVDGHDFIHNALEHGATSFIINRDKMYCFDQIEKSLFKTLNIALVANVSGALIALASAWRAQFSCPIIGITGSVGKTSTKEMLAHIVRISGKKCLSSLGNYNTLLGISLTLLDLRHDHDCAIIEMGINKRGEMAKMAALVRPTFAIITAIAHSHMEGLGSLNDIAAEKRQIFSCFKENNIGIINGDQNILSSVSYPHPVVRFGCKTTNQVQARKIQVHGFTTTFMLKIYHDRYVITLPTAHSSWIFNSLASAAAAYFLKIDAGYIIAGIQSAQIVQGRFELRTLPKYNGFVIDDCYNANPESMKAALLAFENIESSGKKIAILGDMLELGVNAPFWHRQLGRFLKKTPSLDHVIFVGKYIKSAEKTIPRSLSFASFDTWQDALVALEKELNEHATVLIKASRGMKFNNLVERLVAL